ncbi:MAG: hypothetical protein H6816_04215 [Phycisphaerales bacterium]|nr:hypothetical protein [Phycisphaerales bacterium]
MDGYRIVVMKSTVPVGTHRAIWRIYGACCTRSTTFQPGLSSEGAPSTTSMRPDRVIIAPTTPRSSRS